MTVLTNLHVHHVRQITAYSTFSLGSPLVLKLIGDDGTLSLVTIFTDNDALTKRMIDAINAATAEPDDLPDAAHQAAHSAVHILYNGGPHEGV
jgi:hypothetical protein